MRNIIRTDKDLDFLDRVILKRPITNDYTVNQTEIDMVTKYIINCDIVNDVIKSIDKNIIEINFDFKYIIGAFEKYCYSLLGLDDILDIKYNEGNVINSLIQQFKRSEDRTNSLSVTLVDDSIVVRLDMEKLNNDHNDIIRTDMCNAEIHGSTFEITYQGYDFIIISNESGEMIINRAMIPYMPIRIF